MEKLIVDLAERSYPIYIGQQLIDQLEYYQPHIDGQQVLIVTNDTVAPLYLEQVKQTLADHYQVAEVILPDGEQYKNLVTVEKVYDALLTNKFNRTVTLVALGGGVIGDITGFAAATYQRGVNFIQVPTTLLAQVDSSVGGKTGVNHPQGKNMIGAFYQPKCVIADTTTLNTLPSRELSAGIAEVIKYGLISDKPFFDWLTENIDSLVSRNSDNLSYAILRSCENKAWVVAQDEKEGGIRAILNLGHTFGHAIENYMGYGKWLHGEAVAAGMVQAADLSCRIGWIAASEVLEIQSLLKQANLPIKPPKEMSCNDYLELMAVDKKVIDGQLRLVLLESIGKAIVTADFDRQLLLDTLS
ncbi:3-dehydroquinate synthase [Endozoicomonas sp. SM1973]|uniref:3-dehydroquinate synthase n=1 Tax=Spartinivicinus marinus TaxID=2994442 RepID=A0A853I2K9_9GAMM|nr:3-dehydroquinate synthase [Spartinivicinus marinus]MCX4026467.1 3-dehydroquinate synthase [Spartinivicinus marinus]NYZ66839.1 3-dehydroquinate synthase [Spartinivicinus marinus]